MTSRQLTENAKSIAAAAIASGLLSQGKAVPLKKRIVKEPKGAPCSIHYRSPGGRLKCPSFIISPN